MGNEAVPVGDGVGGAGLDAPRQAGVPSLRDSGFQGPRTQGLGPGLPSFARFAGRNRLNSVSGAASGKPTRLV